MRKELGDYVIYFYIGQLALHWIDFEFASYYFK